MKYSHPSVVKGISEPFSSFKDIRTSLRLKIGRKVDEYMDYSLNRPLWQQLEMDLRQQFRFRNRI